MDYNLVKEILHLVEDFQKSNLKNTFSSDLMGFKDWIVENHNNSFPLSTLNWDGKEEGRSAESLISTLLVHLNRYAKSYSKAAILGTEFVTQEDFIYLINLKAFGSMSKMELIKKNVQEKPVGMLIINRLMTKGWVVQQSSSEDKRSKILSITNEGLEVLDKQMDKIRSATNIVSANLTDIEKCQLILLLSKLNDFHREIFDLNLDPKDILQTLLTDKK